VEAGLTFARRTGSEQSGQWLETYRWLAGVMRGECAAGEAVPIDTHAANPLGLLFAHITRAIAAVIFEDPCGLGRHTAAAMPLLPTVSGHYVTPWSQKLLRGLALALQARGDRPVTSAGRLLSTRRCDRLAGCPRRGRPTNFLHLLRLAGSRTGLDRWRLPRRRSCVRRGACARPGSVSACGTVP